MEVSKYIMLFHKKMKGDINSQEQKELSDWLQQEDSRGLEKAWGLSQRYKENYEPDVDAGLSRLQQRIASSGRAEIGLGCVHCRPGVGPSPGFLPPPPSPCWPPLAGGGQAMGMPLIKIMLYFILPEPANRLRLYCRMAPSSC